MKNSVAVSQRQSEGRASEKTCSCTLNPARTRQIGAAQPRYTP